MDIIINIYIYIIYIYIYVLYVFLYIKLYLYIYIYSIRFPAPLTPSRASSYDFADANSESYSPRAAFAAPQGRFPDSGCANCHPELGLGGLLSKNKNNGKVKDPFESQYPWRPRLCSAAPAIGTTARWPVIFWSHETMNVKNPLLEVQSNPVNEHA